MKCPICNTEVTPTLNQKKRMRDNKEYQPTCRTDKCRVAQVKKGGFNRGL